MKDFFFDNDLKIVGGDFQITNSDNQHVALLASTAAGDWKQNPAAGMGLNRFLKSDISDITKMLHIVNIQLMADGVLKKTVKYINSQLSIDASYNS